MTTLTTFSDALAEAVAKAGAGVVRVEARRRQAASGTIWAADGVVVTAHHVLERDDNIRVGLPSGDTVAAQLVGRDPRTDLAVLRVQSGGLAPPAWADPASLRVGHLALAVGRPGQTVQATLGIVSALGEGRRLPTRGRIDTYIQTDAVMAPGFSGGPLIAADGSVIGLNTSGVWRSATLTLPYPTVRRSVEALLSHGRVRWGYLGVSAQPVRLPPGLAESLNQETAVMLASIEPDSPADRSGLVIGDIVARMDGQPVRHLDELLSALSDETIGKTVSLTIVRGGQVTEASVVIGEQG